MMLIQRFPSQCIKGALCITVAEILDARGHQYISKRHFVALQGEMPKRAVTGVEFFNRFPPLHSYLLGQLQEAAQGVQEGTTQMHPSLYPILVLLSRLRHSTQAASTTGVIC